MRTIGAAAISLLLLSSCGGSNQPQATPRAPLSAEMIVKPTNGAEFLACDSKERLSEAELHIAKQEKTKLEGMLANGTCTSAAGYLRYKILSVDGDVVEFVDSGSRAAAGAWAAVESFEPAP